LVVRQKIEGRFNFGRTAKNPCFVETETERDLLQEPGSADSLVAGLGALHGVRPEDDFDAAGDAAARKFCLNLLDPHLLEVDEPRLVDVQDEP
jgi:hypothetical protein